MDVAMNSTAPVTWSGVSQNLIRIVMSYIQTQIHKEALLSDGTLKLRAQNTMLFTVCTDCVCHELV